MRTTVSDFWWRRAGYGLLLGTSIALLEFAYYYPLVSRPDALGAGLLASMLLPWCGEGVLLAMTVGLFELANLKSTVALPSRSVAALVALSASRGAK